MRTRAWRLWSMMAVVSSISTPSLAATWICVPDQATGFSLENGNWVQTNFRVGGRSLVANEVTPYNDGTGLTVGMEVTPTGDANPMYWCPVRSPEAVQVACGGLGWGIVINFTTLRYQSYYGIGYVDGRDEPGNTPMIEIGRCSKVR